MIEALELLATPSAQLAYETSLTHAGHAPSELVSTFCDDLFHPLNLASGGEFTNDVLKDLAHLYGLIVEVGTSRNPTVASMLNDPLWRRVVALAGGHLERLVHGHGRTSRCT